MWGNVFLKLTNKNSSVRLWELLFHQVNGVHWRGRGGRSDCERPPAPDICIVNEHPLAPPRRPANC